ncbi:hypothetical protein Droror1_Dr00028051 [Drosera rotundifolia]
MGIYERIGFGVEEEARGSEGGEGRAGQRLRQQRLASPSPTCRLSVSVTAVAAAQLSPPLHFLPLSPPPPPRTLFSHISLNPFSFSHPSPPTSPPPQPPPPSPPSSPLPSAATSSMETDTTTVDANDNSKMAKNRDECLACGS